MISPDSCVFVCVFFCEWGVSVREEDGLGVCAWVTEV